jgi:hypothetical protein
MGPYGTVLAIRVNCCVAISANTRLSCDPSPLFHQQQQQFQRFGRLCRLSVLQRNKFNLKEEIIKLMLVKYSSDETISCVNNELTWNTEKDGGYII